MAGAYEFPYAPYANTHGDELYLDGAAADGGLYYKTYDGTAWGEWAVVNEDLQAGADQPYAVEWGGCNNVFWTGEDGKVYWNRCGGTAWTGAKALTGEGAYGDAPEQAPYASATGKDGHAYYTYYDGQAWSDEWTDLGDNYAYDPYTYQYGDGYYLTYTGADKYNYYKQYTAGEGDGGYGAEPTEDDGY